MGWLDWFRSRRWWALVGGSELGARYCDAPEKALQTVPAMFRIAINMAASVGALALIDANHWLPQLSRWSQMLLAGVSAMAFFRTLQFIVRAGDRDVGVGPGGSLQIFLSAADRSVDRIRAQRRSEAAGKIMEGVDYEKAFESLSPYCLALMQSKFCLPINQNRLVLLRLSTANL